MAKPSAIIVDIDGTLSHNTGRDWFDYTLVHTDALDLVIHDLVERYRQDHRIIILTGRDDSCEEQTKDWFRRNGIKWDLFFMRKEGDKRQDSVVKQEVYENHIKEQYHVVFVLEDRNQVVDMWRNNGLKCLQVEPGDF